MGSKIGWKRHGSRCLVLLAGFRAVEKAARFADERLLAAGTGDGHVRLIDGDVCFAALRPKQLTAGLADQRLFTEAAFHQQISQQSEPERQRGAVRFAGAQAWTNCHCYFPATTAMAPVSEM